jgi:hypothetical protein
VVIDCSVQAGRTDRGAVARSAHTGQGSAIDRWTNRKPGSGGIDGIFGLRRGYRIEPATPSVD